MRVASSSSKQQAESEVGAIMQIFHGAGNDMIWLQRDFQLHVTACFDTLQAAQVRSAVPSIDIDPSVRKI